MQIRNTDKPCPFHGATVEPSSIKEVFLGSQPPPALSLRVNLLGLYLFIELRLSLPQVSKLWKWFLRVSAPQHKNGNGKDPSANASHMGDSTQRTQSDAH